MNNNSTHWVRIPACRGMREREFVSGGWPFFGMVLLTLVFCGGFAAAVDAADQYGKRGWLGVQIGDVSAANAEMLEYRGKGGALVVEVTENSPALIAGIARYDIITGVNGLAITDSKHLAKTIGSLTPGEIVMIDLFRKGQPMRLPVVLGGIDGGLLSPQEPDKSLGPPAGRKINSEDRHAARGQERTASSQVRDIQRRLHALGYNPGPVDGLMGKRTGNAIKAYQRNMELLETGQPSAALLADLEQRASQGRDEDASSTRPGAAKPDMDGLGDLNDLGDF